MDNSPSDKAAPKIRKSRPEERRSKTMSRRQLLREERRRRRMGDVIEPVDYERPRSRADCYKIGRPCLYVSCKHHLYLDVNPVTGSVKVNFPGREVWELTETCALDIAERGGITLEEVGDIMNLTRERIRQLETSGLHKLHDVSEDYELDDFLDWDPLYNDE
jgi:hypothetical protein